MQNKWMIMVLMVSLAMNTAFVAVVGYAYLLNPDRPHPRTNHFSGRDHHFYKVLKLTPSQMQQMTPMAASFHERLNRLYAEMESRKEKMIRVLGGEKQSVDQVENLRREMAAVQNKIQKTVIAHILDVKALLDAGQQKRFFNLLREHMIREHPFFSPPGEK
jgi:Spy/CpxP family protein refolding chaperone